jgi:hypothetical protein
MHDPTTGEWHYLQTKYAPEWAVGEARRRKEQYRGGNRRAYRLTSSEMEGLWRRSLRSTRESSKITRSRRTRRGS